MFRNRKIAGLALAAKLEKFNSDQGIVLAVPRGGVPVGYEVARHLGLPLELILIKKLGHPNNKEYAIGAVGMTDRIVVPHDDVSPVYIETETERVRERLREMHRKFMGDTPPQNLKGKTVFVIDDGVATGTTLLTTVRMIRKQDPANIIIAVPVASRQAAQMLAAEVDDVIVLLMPEVFYGVGRFYEDFKQLTDEEVIDYLTRFNRGNT